MTQNKSVSNAAKRYNDYLVYLSLLPFALPLLYCLYNNSMTYIGGWYASWSIFFMLLLIVLSKRILLNLDKIIFSSAAIYFFFGTVLISFSYTTVGKYLAFYTPSLDPGIFFSMIQAVLVGKFGFSPVAGIYHFGTHQNYILLLLTPLYAVFNSPIFLQFTGGAVVWGAGIILWKIVRLYFNQFIALCCVIAFYSSPLNHFYGFRPEIFYPLALFTLYYVCETNKKLIVIILATMFLMSIKEDAPLYIPGFIYLLLRKKNYKAAIFIGCLALGTVLTNLLIIQPYFVHKSGLDAANTLGFYNQWGKTNKEVALGIITHPLDIISLMFDSTSGFWYTFGYWLFIPLLSPFLLLTSILPLIMFTTSNMMRMHVLSEYYAIGPSVVAYIGTINGLFIISNKFKDWKRYINIVIPFLFLIHNLLFIRFYDLAKIDYSQLTTEQSADLLVSAPMYRGRWQEFFPVNGQDLEDFGKLNQELLEKYKNSRICATNQVYPHLDYRVYPLLQPFGGENINRDNCINVFAIIGDIWPVSSDSLRNQIMNMLQTQKCNRFGNFFYCDNLTK